MNFNKGIITPTWGDILITKHKSFEYQFEGSKMMANDPSPIEFSLRRNTKCDHAGIDFTFGIRGLFWMNFNIHDNRHWDYENAHPLPASHAFLHSSLPTEQTHSSPTHEGEDCQGLHLPDSG